MPSLGNLYGGRWDEPARRPGVGQGKGRGITKAPLRRGKRRRR